MNISEQQSRIIQTTYSNLSMSQGFDLVTITVNMLYLSSSTSGNAGKASLAMRAPKTSHPFYENTAVMKQILFEATRLQMVFQNQLELTVQGKQRLEYHVNHVHSDTDRHVSQKHTRRQQTKLRHVFFDKPVCRDKVITYNRKHKGSKPYCRQNQGNKIREAEELSFSSCILLHFFLDFIRKKGKAPTDILQQKATVNISNTSPGGHNIPTPRTRRRGRQCQQKA